MTLFEKKQQILRLNQSKDGLSANELTELLNEYEFLAVEPYLTTPKFWTVLGRYTLRLAGLPFFIVIALIYSLLRFFLFVINFIRWGGQAISYTRHVNYNTIADVYVKVEELVNKTEK
jgi:hypothetical protein